jgi:hypothetical protein
MVFPFRKGGAKLLSTIEFKEDKHSVSCWERFSNFIYIFVCFLPQNVPPKGRAFCHSYLNLSLISGLPRKGGVKERRQSYQLLSTIEFKEEELPTPFVHWLNVQCYNTINIITAYSKSNGKYMLMLHK